MLIVKQPPETQNGARRDARSAAPFIVGTGRCGTTLLRLMIDAHPDIAIPPETHFIPGLAEKVLGSKDPVKEFIATVTSCPHWPNFHLEVERLASRLAQLSPFDLADAIRAFYQLYCDKFGKPRWGDKTPLYAESMQLIQRILPEARFIHLIRDGRDVALSVKDLWWGPNSIWSAAEWWVAGIKSARRQIEQLTHYMEIRYEDLVNDPETVLKRVCAFIDLPWHPNMLDYHRQAEIRMAEFTPVKDDAGRVLMDAAQRIQAHVLTKKPPQKDRSGRWRTAMTEADRADFETVAGPVLKELGYEVASGAAAAGVYVAWCDRLEQATRELAALLPTGSTFILVDQDEWGTKDGFNAGHRMRFPRSADGHYAGPPQNDQAAIAELESLRRAGAEYAIFAWPAFWWLEEYAGLAQFLRSSFRCVTESQQVIVFDLRTPPGAAVGGGAR